jgi:hypothetical protein
MFLACDMNKTFKTITVNNAVKKSAEGTALSVDEIVVFERR